MVSVADFFFLKGPTLAPGPHPGELTAYQTSFTRHTTHHLINCGRIVGTAYEEIIVSQRTKLPGAHLF